MTKGKKDIVWSVLSSGRIFAAGFIMPLLLLAGCVKEEVNGDQLATPDWTEETHGNNSDPDFSTVFPQGKVLRFDIAVSETDWTRMQSDLTANVRTGNPPPPVDPDWEPVWVPCSFRFSGREWYKVGIRYKGNSSLKECVRRNIRKYSFKLDFDQFEDEYVDINDQRFYGFKQLNLSNGFDDMTLMREKTTSDLFLKFGIPAAHTAFCEVWVDFGDGSKYFGLYTLIEEVDDTVIETQFEPGGNLYKPEGPAATFAPGTFNTRQLDKKTNTSENDFSDAKALYDNINSNLRTTDPTAWKNALDDIFDTDHFLKWLASNTVIQNWDTYGKMSHNYYLYNDPADNRLTWIPWDNNEALRPGKNGGALTLSLEEVTAGWPLIRYLVDDPGFRATYDSYLQTFLAGPFSVSSYQLTVNTQAQLIRQYAVAELPGYTFLSSPSVFDPAVDELRQHVVNRHDAVSAYLGN